jgi:hypothetical protein
MSNSAAGPKTATSSKVGDTLNQIDDDEPDDWYKLFLELGAASC